MAACGFCGKEVPPGVGVRVFKRDGTSVKYCSRKCDKYAAMGREAKKLKWTRTAARPVAPKALPTKAPG